MRLQGVTNRSHRSIRSDVAGEVYMPEMQEQPAGERKGKNVATTTPTVEQLTALVKMLKEAHLEMRDYGKKAGLAIVKFIKIYVGLERGYAMVAFKRGEGEAARQAGEAARKELDAFKFSKETVQRFHAINEHARVLESIPGSLPSSLEGIYVVACALVKYKTIIMAAVKNGELTPESTVKEIKALVAAERDKGNEVRAGATVSSPPVIPEPAEQVIQWLNEQRLPKSLKFGTITCKIDGLKIVQDAAGTFRGTFEIRQVTRVNGKWPATLPRKLVQQMEAAGL
jgi:hypothetical protein